MGNDLINKKSDKILFLEENAMDEMYYALEQNLFTW